MKRRTTGILVALALMGNVIPGLANAAGGLNPLDALLTHDVFVSPAAVSSATERASESARLQRTVSDARGRGISEKIALIGTYTPSLGSAGGVAHWIRANLNLSGAVVVVARGGTITTGRNKGVSVPGGIGVSSDKLPTNELVSIADAARPRCFSSRVACAAFAGEQVAARVQANNGPSNRNATIFWLIVLAILGAVILFVVRRTLRRRSTITARVADMRKAADTTLTQADMAVEEIERATHGGTNLPATAQGEYDRALGLRDRAKVELQRATTPAELTQSNQDAAQAVLALKGVMGTLGISGSLTSPLDVPEHRCFYCGRTDRPPYSSHTIQDERGNSMQVEICETDRTLLDQGRQPRVATASYQGATVPWYAVPGNPWYYGYGGPMWQYWLPLYAGMELGGWFGGGYGYGYGYGDWDDSGNGGYDQGSDVGQGAVTDTGNADFGTGSTSGDWGSGGGFDSGSSGGDFGGGGGDFGGGGGDFG